MGAPMRMALRDAYGILALGTNLDPSDGEGGGGQRLFVDLAFSKISFHNLPILMGHWQRG